jgi:uncharacterized protein (TIGR02285 family)
MKTRRRLRLSHRVVAAAALAWAVVAAHAQQLPVMTWILVDFPPAAMPVDGKPGQGVTDAIVRFVIKNWPEAEHRFTVVNANRAWAMLANGQEACYPTAIHTPERDKIALFADVNVLPPPQLVVRKDAAGRLPLNANGEVKLAELLAQGDMAGLLVEKRSYGPRLDALIAQRPAGSSAKLMVSSDFGARILKMVAFNRADYTLEHDLTLAYLQKTDAANYGNLLGYPIEGNSETLVAGFACPRTAWGRQAVTRIDQIISRNIDARELREPLERWMTPETLKRFTPTINAYVAQRKHQIAPTVYPQN